MLGISSLLVWETVQGGEVAWWPWKRPGGGHPDQAGEEDVHPAPGQEDPQPDDRGGHDGHGQGLKKLESLPHEGAQASAILQDTSFTDCGVKDDLSNTTKVWAKMLIIFLRKKII